LIIFPALFAFFGLNTVLMIAACWQVLEEMFPSAFQVGQGAKFLARSLLAVWLTCLGFIFWLPMAVFGPIVLYYIGYFPRGFPLIWPLFRRYDGALVMRGLALALRHGMPMPQALKLVEESYPLPVVSQRLAAARQRVEAGQDWRESLRRTRLITQTDVAVLAAAERAGNLVWALDEMAASSLRRQAHRVQVALQILFPVLLLSIGFVVFVLVCGLFMPLVSLIQGLA
jgi:type II secretory pathway component PulF